MTITQLKERFEFYAINQKAIKHNPAIKKEHAFFHVDLDAIQQAASNGIKFPALYLQTPEVEKGGAYDNMSENYDFTFIVLQKAKSPEDKALIFDECKSICDTIINRLLLDVSIEVMPGVVAGTNEGAFGPVTDYIFGWAVSCAVSDGYDAEAKPSDWEDLS